MKFWAIKYHDGTYRPMSSESMARQVYSSALDQKVVQVEITEVGSDQDVAKNATPEISEREKLAARYSEVLISRANLDWAELQSVVRWSIRLADEFLAFAEKERSKCF